MIYAGIDLGGTTIKGALVSEDGKIGLSIKQAMPPEEAAQRVHDHFCSHFTYDRAEESISQSSSKATIRRSRWQSAKKSVPED